MILIIGSLGRMEAIPPSSLQRLLEEGWPLEQKLRPPAFPLVVKDPTNNVWLPADRLTDAWPVHWTGAIKAIAGLIRIDNQVYRWCGMPGAPLPSVEQIGSWVLPTRTRFQTVAGGVKLTVVFYSPALPDSFPALSCPFSFIVAEVKSQDGKPHRVALYVDISGEWASNNAEDRILWQSGKTKEGWPFFLFQRENQRLLQEERDYPAWGKVFWAGVDFDLEWEAGPHSLRQHFVEGGSLARRVDLRQPRRIREDWPVFAFVKNFGEVKERGQSVVFALGHLRTPGVSFRGEPLPPWWYRWAKSPEELLSKALQQIGTWVKKSVKLDQDLREKAQKVKVDGYEDLLSLAYRQVLGSGELVSAPGYPLPYFFIKEISSGSFIQTIDVIYPCAPFLILHNPQLLTCILQPIFAYVEKDPNPPPYAPHDLGTYPRATGQTYPAPMPIEESANMILLTALGMGEGKEALWVKRYFPLLRRWADYLKQHTLDPEQQLSTDDFTGPSAHNANLALKGVLALGAFTQILERLGQGQEAKEWQAVAEDYARQWRLRAEAGGHWVRIYGEKPTWSIKYNLLFDRWLGLNLIPQEEIQQELDFYCQQIRPYGVPLEDRFSYTKTDWEAWVASLDLQHPLSRQILRSLVEVFHKSPDRVPLSDWVEVDSARVRGFRARFVQGGLWSPLLPLEKGYGRKKGRGPNLSP